MGKPETGDTRGERLPARSPDPAEVDRLPDGALLASRYKVVRFIARGGMGAVYEVEDEILRERVALKTIRRSLARDEAAMARFRREIQLARKITHPNVCRSFDIGVHDPNGGGEVTFLTMELLRGPTLLDRLREKGPLAAAEALPLARQMAGALSAAHRVGVVHRDFKADNVILVAGERGAERAVVTDFGLARPVGDSAADTTNVTAGAVMIGTPSTMAPEQVSGGEIGPAADLYALGVVLFQMVTGRLPFDGPTALAVATRRLSEPAPRASSVAPAVDPRWDAAIARCLERAPADRFASADEVVAALDAPGSGAQPSGGGFVAELKRRKVFRAAAAYAVGAFAILQLADIVSDPLALPRWVMTALVAAAALGFPVAMGIAWLYDLTGRGLVKAGAARPAVRGGLRFTAALVAVAAVAAAAAVIVMRHRDEVSSGRIDVGDRAALLVADFDNQTGDRELDGLSGMLTTALDQSPHLAVVSRSRTLDLLRAMGRPDSAHIDEALGRELCRRAGVRVLVLPAIRRFDQTYALDLKALDVASGDYMATIKQEAAGKGGIPGLIDAVSERLRAELSESPDQIRAASRPVASVTTANLEAYSLYFQGERLTWRGTEKGTEEGLALLRKAVELDPTFALAWWKIAYGEEWGHKGSPEQARAMEQAIRHADRAPPRERLLIEAWHAHLDGDDDRAAALYDRAIAEHEPDGTAFFLAGDLQYHLGRYARAEPLFEKALALDADRPATFDHLFRSLEALGRKDELLPLARRAPEPSRTLLAGRALAVSGDFAGARAALRALPSDPDPQVDAMRWGELLLIEMATGNLAAAGEAARRAQDAHNRIAVPMFALWRGRIHDYDRAAQELIRHPPSPGMDVQAAHGLAALHASFGYPAAQPPLTGGITRAQALSGASAMRLFYAEWMGDYASALASASADRAPAEERTVYERLVAGELDGAVAALAELAAQPAGGDLRRYRLLALADFSHRAGRPRDALAAIDQLLATYPGSPAGIPVEGWALHLAGVCHEELGDPRAARATYQRLLSMWKDADPDLPLLLDTRARAARLKDSFR